MNTKTLFLALALALLLPTAALLAGCGSSAKVSTSSTTTGQALQDLEDARDKGLITESEYQKQRKKILEGK